MVFLYKTLVFILFVYSGLVWVERSMPGDEIRGLQD